MRAKLMKVLSAVGAVIVAIVVALLSTQGSGESGTATAAPVSGISVTSTTSAAATPTDSAVASQEAGVPDRAYATLEEIDAGRWPDSADAPGTKGGQTFQNREGQLPDTDDSGNTLSYQEWDVNPKKPGQSRDAERIVTGSDGSAWYTGDHYDTFTRMR